jgi:hypothetical protein
MAWESRGGAGRYYTRSRKVGGKVVRQYVGTGPVAELAAALDRAIRADRADRTRRWKAALAAVTAAQTALTEFLSAADTLTRAALAAAGFHRHDRGEWRCRTHVQKPEPNPPARRGRRAHEPAAPCGTG